MMPNEVRGVAAMNDKIRSFTRQFPAIVRPAMREEAEVEATESKKRAPVYSGPTGPNYPIPGVLRASIHVEGPFQRGSMIYADIVAGGAAGAYALSQHEELDWFHKIGEAKYIESVIMESRAFMAARLAANIRNRIAMLGGL